MYFLFTDAKVKILSGEVPGAFCVGSFIFVYCYLFMIISQSVIPIISPKLKTGFKGNIIGVGTALAQIAV